MEDTPRRLERPLQKDCVYLTVRLPDPGTGEREPDQWYFREDGTDGHYSNLLKWISHKRILEVQKQNKDSRGQKKKKKKMKKTK